MHDDLTPAELAAITGRKRPAAIAAALAKRGVPFVFSGAAVRVQRVIAVAHELLPQSQRGAGVDLSRVK